MKSESRLSHFFYNNFRRYHRYRRWYFRRFTTIGQFAQGVLLFSAVLGINTQQAVAYQIFGLTFAMFIVALARVTFLNRPALPTLSILRLLPRYATVGEEVRYRLRLSQHSSATLTGFSLIESHHDPRPDFIQFSQAREPGSERLNRYDRFIGYYRWSWLIKKNEVSQIDELQLPPLPPGKPIEVQHNFTPRFRGQLTLSGVTVARLDPLGLCRATRELPLPGSILVLPRTYQIPPLNLPGQLHHQPEHRVSAAANGDGEEIAGLRDYRPGDSLRDIHWKSFARTGMPVVKEYQAEYCERHALLLDNFGTPEGAAFEEAVSLAASFVGNLYSGQCLLDLLFVEAQCHCFTMGPGELQAEALMRVLALVKPCADAALPALTSSILSRRSELSSCICILLDWDAERQQMISELRAHGLPLLVLLVSQLPPNDCPQWLHRIIPGKVEEGLSQL